MPTTITPELPNTPDAITLINELEAVLSPLYPDESRHGFSVDMLIAQGVAFFITRVDGTPAGCGGIKLFGTEYGEVKRMYVRPQFRGLGLAKQMLEQLAAHAQQNGVTVLRLETGMHQTEAMKLYEGWGFTRIGPFGEYIDDPLSRYYEKKI
jgi:putative acetyltransferase